MRTSLAPLHEAAGARFIEFSGWEMPVHYGSQLAEHHAVRDQAGCFDVSHMAVVDVSGADCELLLNRLLVGDIRKLSPHQGFYTLMLNEAAGIVDDLIAYRRADDVRLVINAGTTQADLDWINMQCGKLGASSTINHRSDLCIVAVQGPHAIAKVSACTGLDELSALDRFHVYENDEFFIARTGYTGEDGVEIVCGAETAYKLWEQLVAEGVVPAGLGARDSLRLEAGLNLYGHDMNDATHPLESRLAWTVDWSDPDRAFVGRDNLESIRASGSTKKLIGLKLSERGIPREGCVVVTEAGEGVVTSGTFSPTLGQGIALARVPSSTRGACQVQIRKRAIPAKISRLPFVAKSR